MLSKCAIIFPENTCTGMSLRGTLPGTSAPLCGTSSWALKTALSLGLQEVLKSSNSWVVAIFLGIFIFQYGEPPADGNQRIHNLSLYYSDRFWWAFNDKGDKSKVGRLLEYWFFTEPEFLMLKTNHFFTSAWNVWSQKVTRDIFLESWIKWEFWLPYVKVN